MPLSKGKNPSSTTSAGKIKAEVFSSAAAAKPLSVTEMEAMAQKLRRHIVTMTGKAGSGHPGGSLSAVEIVTALYFGLLRHNPREPSRPDRFTRSASGENERSMACGAASSGRTSSVARCWLSAGVA